MIHLRLSTVADGNRTFATRIKCLAGVRVVFAPMPRLAVIADGHGVAAFADYLGILAAGEAVGATRRGAGADAHGAAGGGRAVADADRIVCGTGSVADGNAGVAGRDGADAQRQAILPRGEVSARHKRTNKLIDAGFIDRHPGD